MVHRQTFLALVALISSSPIGCASSSKTHPVGGTLSREDEIRATLNKPPKGSHVLATDPKQTVASVLNQHLHQAMSPDKIRPCDSFDIEELNDVLAALLEVSHPSLQEMYLSKRCDDASANARCDKRSMRHPQGIAGYREEWQDEMDMLRAIPDDSVKAVVESVLRKGKCFEAVQLYYHHLSEESRQQFQPSLPLLPDNQDDIKILARLNQQIQGMTKHESHSVDAHGDYVHSDHHHHQHRWLKEIATGNTNSNNTDDAGHDDVDNILFYQDDVHTNTFSQETYNAKLKFLSAALGPGSGFENTLADLMAKYNTQSPCAMSHRVIAKPWTIESAEEAGVSAEVATFIAAQLQNDTFNTGGVPSKDYPDTTIPGAGYIPCDQADVCLEGGDRKYMIQAAVRSYVVPGSAKIQKSNSVTPNTVDYAFHTRTFEGMPESPSKFGPDAAGGDGTLGLLGPAIVANPGERVHIFVKNNLADTSALGPNVPTPLDFWKRIQVIRNITNTTRYFLNVSYNGPEWPDDEYPFEGTKPLPPDEMMPIAGLENVPGETTDGYDVFNIHMHGWEVAPHLFDPQGTSNPAADWISVSPDETSGRQCYCYRHTISETQSRGDYLYHTHRHGTTTELTWGGMFGLSLTGEESVEEARTNSSSAATLNRDLVAIADAEGLAYNDSDVNIMVIYDSVWSLSNITNENNETSVVVTDFISGFRSTTGLHPYFVNNEYQPTFHARTGALSVFRLACVSAGNLCAFIILEGTNKTENSTIIPFDRVASDGISYNKPIHREGNGNPLIPDLTNTEAYLSMGGGMREVVVAQFPRAGTYQIWMLSNAFDDGNEQLLATVDVTGADAEIKDITGYSLKSARPSIESRPVDEYRGMTFKTNYDQEAYPFPMYGIGDVNGENASAYNLTEFDIGAKGRTCGIWVIRSMDIVLHPFHIHVNPFMILSQKSHWDDNPDLQLFISDYTLPFDVDKGTALTGIWRDTAIVPPYGYLVIKQCYDAGVRPSLGEDVSTFAGKFVFHCHFLVHEDTGLIRNIILASNSTTAPTSGASSVGPKHLATTSMFLAAFVLWFL